MSEKHAPARPEKPAGLLFFEAQEKPRQYVIFDRALVRGRQKNRQEQRVKVAPANEKRVKERKRRA